MKSRQAATAVSLPLLTALLIAMGFAGGYLSAIANATDATVPYVGDCLAADLHATQCGEPMAAWRVSGTYDLANVADDGDRVELCALAGSVSITDIGDRLVCLDAVWKELT